MKLKRKITDHNHDRYIKTRLKQLRRANLGSKNDNANFVTKTDFDNKLKHVTSNKNELNERQKKLKQCQQKD